MSDSVSLLNLDTGESINLGEFTVCKIPQEFKGHLPENEILAIGNLYQDEMLEIIKAEPQWAVNMLFSLSTFLIASRGQKLILLSDQAEEILVETTDYDVSRRCNRVPCLPNDKVGSNRDSHLFKPRILAFMKRRFEWLSINKTPSGPPLGFTQHYIDKRMHAEFVRTEARKSGYGCEAMEEYHPSDYEDVVLYEYDYLQQLGASNLISDEETEM